MGRGLRLCELPLRIGNALVELRPISGRCRARTVERALCPIGDRLERLLRGSGGVLRRSQALPRAGDPLVDACALRLRLRARCVEGILRIPDG